MLQHHDLQLSIVLCFAEWYFRSSLDRYVWIHGMLFAYLHPSFEAALQRIDKLSLRARVAIRTVIVTGENSETSLAFSAFLCTHRHWMPNCSPDLKMN